MPFVASVRASAVVFALLVVGVACASPGSESPGSTSPEARATSVRRTAVAEVQRIIAGNPTPSATTEPTPTPPPSCAGAIWWHEARTHIGESRTIQGPVVHTRPAASASTLLEIGQPYPDPTGVTVLVPAGAAADLTGKTICVGGRIASGEIAPTIDARAGGSVVIVKP